MGKFLRDILPCSILILWIILLNVIQWPSSCSSYQGQYASPQIPNFILYIPIYLFIFGVAYVGVLLYYNSINLIPDVGEVILYSGAASTGKFIRPKYGKLFVTNTRIIFVTPSLTYPPKPIEFNPSKEMGIFIDEILGLEDGIILEQDGISQLFTVFAPRKWVNSIMKAIHKGPT